MLQYLLVLWPVTAVASESPRIPHLSVDAGDVEPCLHAGLHVCLSQGAAEHGLSADTAVEGALGCWVALVRPAEDTLGLAVEHGVLLLQAEPWLGGLDLQCVEEPLKPEPEQPKAVTLNLHQKIPSAAYRL
jgi:hypothetical protein